jgi:hypothetical protein
MSALLEDLPPTSGASVVDTNLNGTFCACGRLSG